METSTKMRQFRIVQLDYFIEPWSEEPGSTTFCDSGPVYRSILKSGTTDNDDAEMRRWTLDQFGLLDEADDREGLEESGHYDGSRFILRVKDGPETKWREIHQFDPAEERRELFGCDPCVNCGQDLCICDCSDCGVSWSQHSLLCCFCNQCGCKGGCAEEVAYFSCEKCGKQDGYPDHCYFCGSCDCQGGCGAEKQMIAETEKFWNRMDHPLWAFRLFWRSYFNGRNFYSLTKRRLKERFKNR